MITVRVRKDRLTYGTGYYINLVKEVNGVKGVKDIFHIGRKTQMEYCNLFLMLDFLNVEYEVDEDWMD